MNKMLWFSTQPEEHSRATWWESSLVDMRMIRCYVPCLQWERADAHDPGIGSVFLALARTIPAPHICADQAIGEIRRRLQGITARQLRKPTSLPQQEDPRKASLIRRTLVINHDENGSDVRTSTWVRVTCEQTIWSKPPAVKTSAEVPGPAHTDKGVTTSRGRRDSQIQHGISNSKVLHRI
jgi:hypothetical protein